MNVWHDDLDLGSRSLDDLEYAKKWTFADFSDTIYSIILKTLPSCRKPKDLYRDVWQDDLDLGSRSLGDLKAVMRQWPYKGREPMTDWAWQSKSKVFVQTGQPTCGYKTKWWQLRELTHKRRVQQLTSHCYCNTAVNAERCLPRGGLGSNAKSRAISPFIAEHWPVDFAVRL